MSASETELVGPFEESERAFLASQFGRCRLELIRRAAHDPTVCLVSWSASYERPTGPSPLRSAPSDAVYVVKGKSLTRVETVAEVERELGEPVGDLTLRGLRRPNPILDGAREALRGLLPWR